MLITNETKMLQDKTMENYILFFKGRCEGLLQDQRE